MATTTAAISAKAMALLVSRTINIHNTGTTILLNAPLGKHVRVIAICFRDPTASCAGGSFKVEYWPVAVTNFNLNNLTASGTGYVWRWLPDVTASHRTDSGNPINFIVNTGSTSSATVTIDVFGYMESY